MEIHTLLFLLLLFIVLASVILSHLFFLMSLPQLVMASLDNNYGEYVECCILAFTVMLMMVSFRLQCYYQAFRLLAFPKRACW